MLESHTTFKSAGSMALFQQRGRACQIVAITPFDDEVGTDRKRQNVSQVSTDLQLQS